MSLESCIFVVLYAVEQNEYFCFASISNILMIGALPIISVL